MSGEVEAELILRAARAALYPEAFDWGDGLRVGAVEKFATWLSACKCGCPPDCHVGELGCPCALPGEPPCLPVREEALRREQASRIARGFDCPDCGGTGSGPIIHDMPDGSARMAACSCGGTGRAVETRP